MDYNAYHGSLEEMIAAGDLPKTLYKYRQWDNIYHQTILTKREIFFAPPTSFEDPVDCKNPLRYDLLTEEDIFNWYYEDAPKMRPNDTELQRKDWATNMAKNSMVKDPVRTKQHNEETFKEWNDRFGVLSLTANPANLAMWEKYSNNHEGFCVGFDPAIIFKFLGGGGIVQYHDMLPTIYPRPRMNFEEQHYYQVFFKEAKWSFEQEYRTHKFSQNPLPESDRIVKVPAEAYKCVILGAKMEEDNKQALIKSLPPELKGIKIFEAVISVGRTHFVEV